MTVLMVHPATSSDKTGMAACHARGRSRCSIDTQSLCREGLSATTGLVGIWIDEFEVSAHQVFLEVQLCPLKIDRALGVNNDFYTVKVMDLVVLAEDAIKAALADYQKKANGALIEAK